MEMHQVRYFLAAARLLNFTRAAEECNVAQPSLTRAIKQLELELGGDLFRRERNLTHLTDLGQRMQPVLQQCFDSAMSAKSLAQSIKSGQVAPLSIALPTTTDIRLTLPFISELVRVLPGLELRFLRGPAAQVCEALRRGEAEVAIGGPLGETWDRLESWQLFNDPYRLVVSEYHALAAQPTVTRDDIRTHRLLMRPYCEHLEEINALLGIEHAPRTAHYLPSDADVLGLVSAEVGIAIMPESSARVPGVRRIEVAGVSLSRQVAVYAVAGRQRSGAASTLIKMLRAHNWLAAV